MILKVGARASLVGRGKREWRVGGMLVHGREGGGKESRTIQVVKGWINTRAQKESVGKS